MLLVNAIAYNKLTIPNPIVATECTSFERSFFTFCFPAFVREAQKSPTLTSMFEPPIVGKSEFRSFPRSFVSIFEVALASGTAVSSAANPAISASVPDADGSLSTSL